MAARLIMPVMLACCLLDEEFASISDSDNRPATFVAFVPVTLGHFDDDSAQVRFKNVPTIPVGESSPVYSNAEIEIILICADAS